MNASGMANLPNGAQVRNEIQNHLLRQQAAPPPGWQQTTAVTERANSVFTIYSQLILLLPNEAGKCLNIAFTFESEAFRTSSSKEQYLHALAQKQEQIAQQRQNKAEKNGMALGNMAQMGMMPPNQMQNPMAGQVPAQGAQGFNPQLQRPMQATPLPQNPQNPYAQSLQTAGMSSTPQSNAQNLSHQQHHPNPGNFTPQEIQRIQQFATTKMQQMSQMSQEQRSAFMANLTNHQRQDVQRSGANALMNYWRQAGMKQLLQLKASQQQNNSNPAPAQNMMAGMGPMRGSQAGFGRPQQQMPISQGTSNNFQDGQDVNVAQILGQQADAQKSQDAGQLVVPASNNPAGAPQMTAQQSVGGQNSMQTQMFNNQPFANQQSAMRAQQHLTQTQQLQAAQAAQARTMSLQGQIGGLNGSQPPQQSPAMPNLNRPMVPPGSNTPQPRAQQGAPSGMQSSPVPMENRMSQQGQMGFPNQNGPNGMQLSRANLIPSNIQPHVRQRLMMLPEAQFQSTLRTMTQPTPQQMAARNNGSQGPNQPQFHMQPGRPQMQQNPLQPNQQGPNIGAQPQHVAPGQHPQQPQPNRALSNIQQAFLHNPAKIAEWDQRPFPPALRAKIPKLPEHCQTWGQVKHFANASPHTSFMNKSLLQAQSQQFESFCVAVQRQRQASGISSEGQMGNMVNPNAMSMPANGPAPPAPMVAPGQQQVPPQAKMAMQPQFPANVPPNVPTVTAQEIANVRQNNGQKVANLTDDQLRQIIWAGKVRTLQNKQGQGVAQGTGNAMHSQPGLAPNALQQPRAQAQLSAAQAQQVPRPQVKPQTAPKVPQQAGPAQMQQNQRGQKRPSSNDDVVEVPPPKAVKTNEAPNMQQSKSQQGSQAQQIDQHRPQAMAKAPANAGKQQNQSTSASTSTNGQPAAPANSNFEEKRKSRVALLMQEIRESITKNSTARNLRQDQLDQLDAMLQQNKSIIDQSIRNAYYYCVKTGDEVLSRQVFQPVILAKVLPESIRTGRPLASPAEFGAALTAINQSVKIMHEKLSEITQQEKAGKPLAAVQGGASEPQTQLNAANLKQHQKETTMMRQASLHKRSNSKTPSAPTSTQPPFQFGAGASSPQGVPAYGPSNELTSDKLKIPPIRKRKAQAGSAASTPGQPTPGSMTSPQVTKSPEVKRAPAPEPAKPAPPKNVFKCQENDCDYKDRGFSTQQELEKHKTDMHPVIDDPLAFALSAVAEWDGCNLDGTLQQSKAAPPAPKKNSGKDASIDKLKPTSVTSAKAATATPMARSATQPTAQASPAKTPLNQASLKAQTPSSTASFAPKTMYTQSGAPVRVGKKAQEAMADAQRESDALNERIHTMTPAEIDEASSRIARELPEEDEEDEEEQATKDEDLMYKLDLFNRQWDAEQAAAKEEAGKKTKKTKASEEATATATAAAAAAAASGPSPPEKTPELSSPSARDDSPRSQRLDGVTPPDPSKDEALQLQGALKRKLGAEDDVFYRRPSKDDDEAEIERIFKRPRYDPCAIDYENPEMPENMFPPGTEADDFYDPYGLKVRVDREDEMILDQEDDYGRYLFDEGIFASIDDPAWETLAKLEATL
ncbi:hypothetical protein EV356DRAFT_570834 [Viridothelium virens]|uniref:Mediator complex subunit 15 KIX domain-containing protein n=1 Tax=Viridothelium virens TaxID=1048519 RepID=A0A6A6GVL0_VIRVR|nr:hypothetical protein EV356DRAFT_570834 [Viridothelium virens]